MRSFLFAGLDALSLFWPQRLAVVRLRRSRVETMATGTPDSQARFGQSVKGLLTEKVNTCGTDVIALTKQVLKGSRSSEVRAAQRGAGRGLPGSGSGLPRLLPAPGGAAHCILGEWALAPRLWQATGCGSLV